MPLYTNLIGSSLIAIDGDKFNQQKPVIDSAGHKIFHLISSSLFQEKLNMLKWYYYTQKKYKKNTIYLYLKVFKIM